MARHQIVLKFIKQDQSGRFMVIKRRTCSYGNKEYSKTLRQAFSGGIKLKAQLIRPA